MAEETEVEQEVDGGKDPLGLDKIYKSRTAPGADPLGLEAALKKKVSPTPASESSGSGAANSLTPHPSSSPQGGGTSLLDQGTADLESVSKGQAPQEFAPHRDENASEASTQEDEAGGYTPQSIIAPFNAGLAKVTDVGAGVFKLYDSIVNPLTPGGGKVDQHDTAWLFDWASKKLRGGEEENPLPENFGGQLTKATVGIVPTIIGAAATGGGSAEAEGFDAIGDAAGGYLSKSQIVQNALTKAAGPLTQYLGVTGAAGGASSGYDESGGQFLPTLLGVLKGGAQGIQEGVALEGQMGAGEVIGGKLFKLALKTGVVNEDGVITQQALKSLVATPAVFATASITDDVANNRPINWVNAGVSGATALPFEAEHLVGAIKESGRIADDKAALDNHINKAMQYSGVNSIINFATADAADIHNALSRPESPNELDVMSLGKGVEAQDAKTLQDKNTLHLAQLELSKQADIKEVANKIISGGQSGFLDAVDQSEIPEELKTTLAQNADLVDKNYNPKTIVHENITENLKEGIDNAQKHIDAIHDAAPGATVSENPEAINALIDTIDARTDMQEKLLDHTENENKPAEAVVDPFQSELEKLGYSKAEIDGFGEEQKLHIIEHQVENEQGIIPKENEASAESGAAEITNSEPAGADTTNNGNAVDATETAKESVPVGEPFMFHSKEHGLIDVQPHEDGKYSAKFADGSTDSFTRDQLHDYFGIEPERFENHEADVRLHATDHPEHIAQMFLDKVNDLHDTGDPESAIAQYAPRGTVKHFTDVNDVNNLTKGIRLNYLTDKGSKIDFHIQADELNRMYFNGRPVVDAEAIANFMIKHPGGERSFFTPSGNEALREIADRYQDITGKKLTKVVAKRIIDAIGAEQKTISETFHGEENMSLVTEMLKDNFNFEPGEGVTPAELADKMRSQFDEYVKDPAEVFNIFYPVFEGLALTEDQQKEVYGFIKDAQDGLEPGGRSGDQPANEPEGAGVGEKDAAETTNVPDTSEGARGTENPEIAAYNEHIGELERGIKETEKQIEKKLAALSKANDLFESTGTKKGEEKVPEMFDTGATNTEPENISKILEPLRGKLESQQRELKEYQDNKEINIAALKNQLELDDIPFQKSTGEQLPEEKVQLAKALISKAFPGIEAKFHVEREDFEKALRDNGIETHADNLPNAFVDEKGAIHFNPEKINADTQLHEYGHILTRWAEKFAPKLYERMQRFGGEAKDIHAELKENGYFLSGKRLNEEAFVTMLGREGSGKLDEAVKNAGKRGVIKSFIADVWNKFQRYLLEKTGFDISKFKNIKNMGVDEFMNTLNSKYLLSGTEVSKTSDLSGENQFQIKRPDRQPGETIAEYARRLGEWKRDLYSNPQGNTRNELNRILAPVRQKLAELNRAFAEGVKATKDAKKEAFLEYDRYRRSQEKVKLSDLKEKWQAKLTAEKDASGEKLARYKEETKQAFLEYDAFKKGETKQRISELRKFYQDKVAEENKARQEQTQKLKEGFHNIRTEINAVLESLRKSGELGGVKFSDRDVLAFANQVNKVTSERGLEKFKDFITRATKNVDFLRDLADNRKLIKSAKELLHKDFVPANMKTLIRELTSLNPNSVESPKELKAILTDINESLRAEQAPMKSESEINDFINKERDADVKTRASELLDQRTDIENSPEHTAVAEQKGSTLPDDYQMRRDAERIIKDPESTHNEKVKALNQISDALDAFHKDVRNSIELLTNEVYRSPRDFQDILEEVKTGTDKTGEGTLRTNLEDNAKEKQAAIEIDPEMSPEQKQSLEILKNVPLSGEDATTLRLFNNVLENVLLNDTHDGVGLFEAKATGNGDDGALKLVKYLEETGRKSKDAGFNTFGEFRRAAIDLSVILSRLARGDNNFITKLTTGTYFDQIKNGFTKGKQVMHDVLNKPLEKVFKDNPDLAKSADSAHRLTLFSYINQNREFSSEEQQDAMLVKRIKTIYKDIHLKINEGTKETQAEGQREQRIWSEFEDKIKEKTGIDVGNPQELARLTYHDIKDISFLSTGERQAYDTIRAADDKLRPDHEAVVKRQLNKPYETWNNHMRDSYRLLKSGLTDVVGGEGLGFNVAAEDNENGSGASMQRVKGDPLAQKEAAHQRVLAMNFFQNQQQSIKDMLYDIHTLKDRQIFDAALKNRELRDALGNENHQIYKDAITAYVKNEMGLNGGMGVKELKLVNKGLNIIAKLGTSRQLFSLLAHPKHYFSNLFNTVATLGADGPKLLAQSYGVMHDQAVQELLKQHPISERADNLASLNMTSNENRSDDDIEGKQDWKKTVLENTEDAINKWLLGINKDGTSNEKLISRPIKVGDTKSAEWSWIAYYAKHLIDNGQAKDFGSIDWNKENAKPNREAADYAENLTSKQMNENTKGGRSKLLTSQNTAFVAGKYLLFPFGSRNMHNFQTLVDNIRTLTDKDTIVDADYRKNNAAAAAHSILGVLAQEAVFQGVRLGGTLAFAYGIKRGLTYLLASYLASDDEKKKLLEKIDAGIDKQKEHFLHQWASETVGGYLLGGLGTGPEQYVLKGVNDLTKHDIFYEPNISVNQKVQDANNLGMIGSAFTGLGDQAKDVYRLIDNHDKYGVPVNITPYQKSVFGISLLSNMLALSGLNDANVNRSIEGMRKAVEFNLASKFHEPNYEDLSAPSALKIGSRSVQLSPQHQEYYQQVKESEQNNLEKKGIDSKRAATISFRRAKAALIEKYGTQSIFSSGRERAKKK